MAESDCCRAVAQENGRESVYAYLDEASELKDLCHSLGHHLSDQELALALVKMDKDRCSAAAEPASHPHASQLPR